MFKNLIVILIFILSFKLAFANSECDQFTDNLNKLESDMRNSSDLILQGFVTHQCEILSSFAKRIIKDRDNNPDKFNIKWGDYYALMIGVDYGDSSFVKLDSTLNDINLIGRTLNEKYNFKDVNYLINPTQAEFYETLEYYQTIDNENYNKNLVIYYAGHGEIDDVTKEGYWIPSDAKENKKWTWISNNSITNELNALNNFKHIIIIADSCYSGTLTASRSSISIPNNIEKRMMNYRSFNNLKTRVALTSGNLNEVQDSYENTAHSPFAISLNNILNNNDDVLISSELHNNIADSLLNIDNFPDPTHGVIKNATDLVNFGRNFIFVKK
tara:strand:- start:3420 stop:4403 length:984 start_codon:yes stop_codon:yes gene_type:complete